MHHPESQNPNKYTKKDFPSHKEVEYMLQDERGFRVKKADLPSMSYAFVGKTWSGELVYIEYILGVGDHYSVYFMRPANAEETEFYYQDDGQKQ
ncbi:MAG: hypothetical protein Q6K90_00655 [Gloeomargarita sp. HHBFW_bins_162]